MALNRPPSEEGPPRAINFPHDPTQSDIARRHKESEAWEALNVGGYRFAKPGTIVGFLISAVLVVLALTPIPPNWPWDIPLALLAVFTTVATVICGLLWFDNRDI